MKIVRFCARSHIGAGRNLAVANAIVAGNTRPFDGRGNHSSGEPKEGIKRCWRGGFAIAKAWQADRSEGGRTTDLLKYLSPRCGRGEMVDAVDSKSTGEVHVGSSPTARTITFVDWIYLLAL